MKKIRNQTEAEQSLERGELRPVPIERTLAKYLNIIFAPAAASKEKPRTKAWPVLDNTTNEKALAQLVVLDTFKPTDVRVLLSLFALHWKAPVNEDGTRDFTLKRLSDGRWSGGGSYGSTPKRLKDALLRLRFNGLILSNIYRNSLTGGLIRDTDTFTILDKLRVIEHLPVDPTTGLPQEKYEHLTSRFRFNKTITTSLENSNIKPMFVAHLLAIDPRAEAALLAALFLDVVMADKTAWQRRAQALISDDLQLTGNYPKPSQRKKMLDRIVSNLQGFPISTGILRLNIELTKDKEDYKLVVSKSALPLLLERRQNLEKPSKAASGANARDRQFTMPFQARTGHPYNLTQEQEQKAEALADFILDTPLASRKTAAPISSSPHRPSQGAMNNPCIGRRSSCPFSISMSLWRYWLGLAVAASQRKSHRPLKSARREGRKGYVKVRLHLANYYILVIR